VESGKSFWLVSARSSKGMCRGSPRTPPGRSKTRAPRTALPTLPTSEACIFEARRGMISNSESQTRPKDPEGHPMAHRFTIGVEEEFQIIDPATCELRSHVSQLVSAASPDIAEQVKHELHQSIVETGTRICENVSELRIEMHRTRGELVAAAERAGLQVAAAGTHPFSSWIDQVISPGERYQHIVEEMGQLARSLLIFGMH